MTEGYGNGLPEPGTHPGLNEFDHLSVLEAYRPGWATPTS